MEDNALSALPESFADLRRLESANLAGNELAELPPDLRRLTRLEVLDLQVRCPENPLKIFKRNHKTES